MHLRSLLAVAESYVPRYGTQYARLNQCLNLPLQAGDPRPDMIGDFAEIPPLARLKKGRGKDTLTGGRHHLVSMLLSHRMRPQP